MKHKEGQGLDIGLNPPPPRKPFFPHPVFQPPVTALANRPFAFPLKRVLGGVLLRLCRAIAFHRRMGRPQKERDLSWTLGANSVVPAVCVDDAELAGSSTVAEVTVLDGEGDSHAPDRPTMAWSEKEGRLSAARTQSPEPWMRAVEEPASKVPPHPLYPDGMPWDAKSRRSSLPSYYQGHTLPEHAFPAAPGPMEWDDPVKMLRYGTRLCWRGVPLNPPPPFSTAQRP